MQVLEPEIHISIFAFRIMIARSILCCMVEKCFFCELVVTFCRENERKIHKNGNIYGAIILCILTKTLDLRSSWLLSFQTDPICCQSFIIA